MQPFPVPVLPTAPRTRARTALVASADRSFRQRLSETLTGLRWQVREAESGAQAWAEADATQPEAVIVDSWLPDLELSEFLKDFREQYPEVDLLTTGSAGTQESPRGPYRQELLYALRRTQDTDTAVWNTAPSLARPENGPQRAPQPLARPIAVPSRVTALAGPLAAGYVQSSSAAQELAGLSHDFRSGEEIQPHGREAVVADRLPELIGNAPVHSRNQPPRTPGGATLDTGADRRADRLRQGAGSRSPAPAVDPQPQAFCRHQLRGNS